MVHQVSCLPSLCLYQIFYFVKTFVHILYCYFFLCLDVFIAHTLYLLFMCCTHLLFMYHIHLLFMCCNYSSFMHYTHSLFMRHIHFPFICTHLLFMYHIHLLFMRCIHIYYLCIILTILFVYVFTIHVLHSFSIHISAIHDVAWSLFNLFFFLIYIKFQAIQPEYCATIKISAQADIHKAHYWLIQLFFSLVHIA